MTSHTVKTARFGDVPFEDADVVTFPEGVLGFPHSSHYVLIQHREGSPFRWLQSLDDGLLAFLVVDPSVYISDYAPDMPSSAARELKLEADTPRLVYTIVTIPPGKVEDMTLNLAGPIVINGALGLGKQIVLDDASYPVKMKVFAAKDGKGQAA